MISGAKSEAQAKEVGKKVAVLCKKTGHSVKFSKFKIENIIGNADAKFPIRLEQLYQDHQFAATYEPELFAGLIYRMLEPKVTLLVFVSGKVILSGARSRQELRDAFSNLFPILQLYQQ